MRHQRKIATLGLCMSLAVFSGCNPTASVIDQATLSLSPNLKTLTVELLFTKSLQATESTSLELEDFGKFFVNPFTATEPLSVGFTLNMDVLNDPGIATQPTTRVLPNGAALPVATPLVLIESPQVASSGLELDGYVDAQNHSWIGVAASFSESSPGFTSDVSQTQVLMSDHDGNAEIIGVASGSTPAVAALFTNVQELIKNGNLVPNEKVILTATGN